MFSSAVSTAASNQTYLEHAVKQLFPNECISTNSRKSVSLKFPESRNFLEVDVWLPERGVCFEFQDEYHYVSTWYNQNSLDAIQQKDTIKHDILRKNEQTVIAVPCWWDGGVESLTGTVNFQRPDLLNPAEISNIALNPEEDFFADRGIADVGELMLASFPISPTFAETISPVNPWWMGEKYDGIRFCWNAKRKQLYTRAGGTLDISPEFLPSMPTETFIDGEVWFGRGNFTDTQAISNSSEFADWDYLRMLAFDVPARQFQNSPFEIRYQSLLANLHIDNPCVINAPRVHLTTTSHLSSSINDIIKQGGEGVILRRPKSIYEPGRSSSLIKLKATRGDTEAIVVEVTADGSVNLELPSGNTLVIPVPKIQSLAMPKKGDIVSLSFEAFSRRGVPVNPTISQIRTDLSWEEVLLNAQRDEAFYHDERRNEEFTAHPMRYLTSGKGTNVRLALEEFARSLNLDPLLPETWYSIPRIEIEQLQVGKSLLKNTQGLAAALISVFPDIGLEEEKFDYFTYNVWDDADARRDWFDKIASSAGFDPLNSNNWYNISINHINHLKGAQLILRNFYSGSLVKALVHLYPEVNWRESNFYLAPPTHWRDRATRRKWFEEFAEEANFDPLIASHWYKVSLKQVLLKKGADLVLRYHSSSVSNALISLFPEIGLEESKFRINRPNYWQSAKNRKLFFEEFARKSKFDPLVVENWYRVGYNDINAIKGGKRVLSYYNNSLPKALTSLFPSLSFSKAKLKGSSRNIPQDTKSRRSWFDSLAAGHKFDPLVAHYWYKLAEKIADIPGIQKYMRYYSGSLYNALGHLYPEMNLDRHKFKQIG